MKTYRYFVTGKTRFPVDMLRHDACWPCNSESASAISASIAHNVSGDGRDYRVELAGLDAPTVDRWRSFGWQVVAPSDYFDRNRRI